ncbi:hypothetical protein CC1G_14086 [Coprinopsis cinerea okayama7|uniref:Uncharacterized protein n=1 Tax=Coprinopsis cinerea (strain Okayama-7 / 130 / ATCC MYA-4618 / FGSC 9003) TaxID=240176 RepID=D6RLA4_COPC7|nr:hypothetical protein CC1G_14086 [Coprinopsis cinerea okayama7\|eukprot:XP_002911554.1 hypothetical protein CC1G_14086 [Coprinopsis cinerea okayama7\
MGFLSFEMVISIVAIQRASVERGSSRRSLPKNDCAATPTGVSRVSTGGGRSKTSTRAACWQWPDLRFAAGKAETGYNGRATTMLG